MKFLLEAASILWVIYVFFCLLYGEWMNRKQPGTAEGLYWWAWLLSAASVCYIVWFKWWF